MLIRTEVDPLSGRLSDQRMRFLGTRAPTLLPVTAAGAPAMMALSAWPWLGHVHNGKFQLVPLAYDAVDYIAPFASDKVGEGLVAVVRNAAGTGTLRVLTIDRLGEPFTQRVLKLGFTPRKLLVDEQLQVMITVEADQGIDSYPQRADLQVRPAPRLPRTVHVNHHNSCCRSRHHHPKTRPSLVVLVVAVAVTPSSGATCIDTCARGAGPTDVGGADLTHIHINVAITASGSCIR